MDELINPNLCYLCYKKKRKQRVKMNHRINREKKSENIRKRKIIINALLCQRNQNVMIV